MNPASNNHGRWLSDKLVGKYLPMGFADACLVFLGDKLKINEIATIDRDFNIYRLKGKKTFTTYIK